MRKTQGDTAAPHCRAGLGGALGGDQVRWHHLEAVCLRFQGSPRSSKTQWKVDPNHFTVLHKCALGLLPTVRKRVQTLCHDLRSLRPPALPVSPTLSSLGFSHYQCLSMPQPAGLGSCCPSELSKAPGSSFRLMSPPHDGLP